MTSPSPPQETGSPQIPLARRQEGGWVAAPRGAPHLPGVLPTTSPQRSSQHFLLAACGPHPKARDAPGLGA